MTYHNAPGGPILSMMADLAKNPDSVAAFKGDPDSVMDRHGLSDSHKTQLKAALTDMEAGNADTMRGLVGDAGVHPDTCFFTI